MISRPAPLAVACGLLLAAALPAQAQLGDLGNALLPFNITYQWAADPIEQGAIIQFQGAWEQRTYDLGIGEISLDGAGTATFGFGLRGVPHASMNINYGPVAYVFQTKTGVEDIRLSGTMVADVRANVNAIGFYSLTADLSNRGELEVLGLRDTLGTETADFDLGPINIRGNIFIDGIAALLQSAGVDTSGLDTIVNKPAVTGKAADLASSAFEKLDTGEKLTAEELAAVVSLETLGAQLGRGLLPAGIGDEDVQALFAQAASQGVDASTVAPIPEPATMSLLAIGTIVLFRRRQKSA